MVKKSLILICILLGASAIQTNAASWEGAGTAANPYKIATVADLEALNEGLTTSNSYYGKYFLQTADIDATSGGSTFAGIGQGNNTSVTFSGTYDGGGKSIHNLKIDGVSYDTNGKADQKTSNITAGLFGFISANGTVKNLTIAADCSFKAFRNVGSIAGKCYGRIENCYNYAPVVAISNAAGGIVGQAADSASTISGCYNAGKVTVGFNTVGGIAGTAEGHLTYCQNDGDVVAEFVNIYKATGQQYGAGGIAGTIGQYATISYNVNTGNVSGTYVVGGITSATPMYGSTLMGNINYGAVSYQYAGSNTIGSIIGSESNRDCTLRHNYFDKQIGYYDGVGTASHVGVDGLTTTRLTDGRSLAGLDSTKYDWIPGQYPVLAAFKDQAAAKANRAIVAYLNENENIQAISAPATLCKAATWTLRKGTAFSLADGTLTAGTHTTLAETDTLVATIGNQTKALLLRSLNYSTQFDGDGTEASPFLIKSTADMALLSTLTNSSHITFEGNYFKVVNDLDFDGTEYAPVAIDGNNFKGDFDGCGKQFKNVNFTISGTSGYRALFGNVGQKGTVRNIVLASGTLSSYRGTAGIAGKVYGTVDNCENHAVIVNTKSSGNGGIAGMVWSGGKVINCRNYTNHESVRTYLGGIAYYVDQDGVVENCYNYGNLTTTLGTAAGIAASCNGTVRRCVNYGSVTSPSTLGGIVSILDGNGLVEGCVNYGELIPDTLKMSATIGGIVASSLYTEGTTNVIKDCSNYGKISAKGNVGGIVGKAQPGIVIDGCANYGKITGLASDSYSMGGGIAGNIETRAKSTNRINRCFNAGDIDADFDYVGGIVGSLNAELADCYNIANVNGKSNVGGIAGAATSTATISGVYSAGTISGDNATTGNIAGSCSATVTSAYFDSTTGTSHSADAATVKGIDTKALCSTTPSAAYINTTGAYPTLSVLADSASANFFAATVLTADGETYANVKSPLTIGTPAETAWTSSANLTVNGNTVNITADGEAWLTKTFRNFAKTYNLHVTANSGVGNIDAQKTIASETYYDLQGHRLTTPTGIVVKVVRYSDGTTSAVKAIAE